MVAPPAILSSSTKAVLRVFTAEPTAEHDRAALMQATGLPSDQLSGVLDRLRELGWVSSRPEPGVPGQRPNRQRQALFSLTANGRREAPKQVAASGSQRWRKRRS